jgi:integrase
LQSIRASDIREWLDGMLRKCAAPGKGHRKAPTKRLSRITVQNTLNLLRCALQDAVERDLLDANPAATVCLPRTKKGVTHEPWTYLHPEEQDALLTCEAIPEADRLLIAFCMGAGLREGEVWNLELVDVRTEANAIVVRYGSKGKPPKNGRIRRVPLFGIAKAALDRWLELLPGRPNPHRLVWPLPSGARRQGGKAPKGWKDWLVTAGLAPERRHDRRPVRWHDLRHTCASSLVAGWWGRRWSLEEVCKLLGHSSIDVTERYAHLAESALTVAAVETDLSRNYPRGEGAARATPRNHRAPPAGIGPATFGLEKVFREFSSSLANY